ADVQAEKDLLRAEFAMSTRRLEMTVEQLNEKYTSQLVELGRKGNAVSRLETERNAQQAEIVALKIQLDALHDQVAAGAARRVHGDAVPLVPTTFSASPSLAGEHPADDAFSAMPTDRLATADAAGGFGPADRIGAAPQAHDFSAGPRAAEVG